MITLRESFGHALAVMNMLLCSGDLARHPYLFWIEAYQNGREHGILIWGGLNTPAYYVADHRNSDQLRVHKGEYSMQGVSDDAYAHQKEFENVEECFLWLEQDILREMRAAQAKQEEMTLARAGKA